MDLFAKLSTYDERSARLAGIGLMLLSIFMFSFGDALGKFMVATYGVGQLLWLRACAAFLVLLRQSVWVNSSCPGLSRASTSLKQRCAKGVDDRIKSGHVDERGSAAE